MKKKLTSSECNALLAKMEDKYFDLVWFIQAESKYRSYLESTDDTVEESEKASARIAATYPEEIAELSGDDGHWVHGFNSGCLAAFRFALDLTGGKDDQEFAITNFPYVDSLVCIKEKRDV